MKVKTFVGPEKISIKKNNGITTHIQPHEELKDAKLHALSPIWRGLHYIYYQQLQHTRKVGIPKQYKKKKY